MTFTSFEVVVVTLPVTVVVLLLLPFPVVVVPVVVARVPSIFAPVPFSSLTLVTFATFDPVDNGSCAGGVAEC